jgi:hypothetical protein
MATLMRSVGRRGVNLRQDVITLQTLLNKNIGALTPLRPLAVTGVVDAPTIAAIEEFQRRVLRTAKPDGLVEPHGRTIALLAGAPRADAVVITGIALPEPAKRVLTEILQAAGLARAQVTSVARTPADQARIMYENIVSHGDKGVAFSYTLYGAAGDKVTKVYEDNRAKPRDEVIRLMAAKIKEVGPSKVSRHISESHYVFDVAPSSIANKPAFVKAAKAHKAVTNVLEPPTDPAYHIEIPKNSAYFSATP